LAVGSLVSNVAGDLDEVFKKNSSGGSIPPMECTELSGFRHAIPGRGSHC
jgi:hypothetical protein